MNPGIAVASSGQDLTLGTVAVKAASDPIVAVPAILIEA